MNNINLFIGLSQNQILAYESLIENKLVKGKKILISSKELSYNDKYWDKFILTNESFNNNSHNTITAIKSIIKKINVYKALIKEVKSLGKAENLNLYFTYIEDVLTNYLLFSFNKHIKGFVVEDGTLNYYNHTIKSIPKLKFLLKYLISNTLGLRFKYYKGHSSGVQYSKVIYQYVKIPDKSILPTKSKLLPFNTKTINPTNSILIIGQEAYINQFGEDKYYKALQRIINIAISNSIKKNIEYIYYKPHRHGCRINYDKLDFSSYKGKLHILNKDVSLEELFFNQIKSKYIYGFDSTVLINLNIELDQSCKKLFRFYSLMVYNNELEDIFRNFNITIYK